jgi:hypothetical protein
MPLPNPARQRKARDKLGEALAHPATVYAIHYACLSLDDGQQTASTRIACIGVRQLASGQTHSFTIAKIAELQRIDPADIPRHWPALEREMLAQFYAFIAGNRAARYVHWNMRDERFGFAALEHRCRVLGGRPVEIHELARIDLAGLLQDIYGDDYVSGGARLDALAKRNRLSLGGFLPGSHEADAVAHGRLREVHASTLAKVRLIAEIAVKAADRTLATDAGLLVRHGGPMRLMVQKMWDNPGITLGSLAVGAFMGFLKFFDWMGL